MKKLTLFIAIVFSGMLMQAQTIDELALDIMGMKYDSKVMYLNTNYGQLKGDLKLRKGIIIEMTITIANYDPQYDSIRKGSAYGAARVGTLMTDIKYKYTKITTRKFSTLSEAQLYYNNYSTRPQTAYKEVSILKNAKKELYIVGRFSEYNSKYYDSHVIYVGKIKDYIIL